MSAYSIEQIAANLEQARQADRRASGSMVLSGIATVAVAYFAESLLAAALCGLWVVSAIVDEATERARVHLWECAGVLAECVKANREQTALDLSRTADIIQGKD